MGALASPLLGCSGHSLFHFHELLLFSGMACSIRLALDRTSLSLSHCFQSTPAPAGQVVHLRWNCGSDHHSRVTSATVHLPFVWASWLVKSACYYTYRYCNLALLAALYWPCHSALPTLG